MLEGLKETPMIASIINLINMTEQEKLEAMAKEIVAKSKKEKKIIRLHHHPDAIKQSIKELSVMSEDDEMKNLFEDILILVEWALARLPIVPPPTKEEDESAS